MTHGSRLHVPRTPARPGEAPDFAYEHVSAAGAVARPEVDAAPQDLEDCSESMVRVLDDQHVATGAWDPRLEQGELHAALRHMLLTRIFDERMLRMQRQGEISFYVSSRGEEAVSVGAAMALPPDAMLFPSYRNQGVQFARGRPPEELMCQCLSNLGDMCKGRQLPTLYHWQAGNIFSVSGNLATQFPQAVAWAMGSAIMGENTVAAAWIGEGSSAEADFHHALTFASVYRAPVVLNVVNNQWAISTFQGFAGGEERSFAARGPGYGIPSFRVDGNDLLAVYAVTRWAGERARRGHGPTLIEQVTYRAGPHSTSDDPGRYRPRDDYAHWPLGDPIERLKQHLVVLGQWDEARHEELAAELSELVAASWQRAVEHGSAHHGPRLDGALLFEDVYREMPDHLRLQRKYGESRVIDAPIAEGGIVGVVVGMGVRGLRPVAEIQFADYIYPGYDQIVSELARLRYRTAGDFFAPVTIRAPCGGGIRGGQTHSQSPEGLFTHVCGLKVVMPSSPYDAKGLLIAAIEDDDPVIFFEPKRLYNGPFDGDPDKPAVAWSAHPGSEMPDGYYSLPIGPAQIVRAGDAVTVLCYGTMVHVAEAVVARMDLDAEIVDVRTMSPLDVDTLTQSVLKTGRCVVLHEATRFSGFGAELCATVQEACFHYLEAPVIRVCGWDTPYPHAFEWQYFPGQKRVAAGLAAVLAE